jgi:hypothetical protein
VIAAVDQLGPPPIIEKIPSPFLESLTATLAYDLACSCAMSLGNYRRKELANIHRDLELEQFGGPKFQVLKKNKENIRQRLVTLKRNRLTLDRLLGPLRLAIEFDANNAATDDIARQTLARMLARYRPRYVERAQLNREIAQLLKDESEIAEAIDSLHATIIKSTLSPQPLGHLENNSKFDFDCQPNQACFFLKNNQFDWWSDFIKITGRLIQKSNFIEKQLRDCRYNEMVTLCSVKQNQIWDAVAADILNRSMEISPDKQIQPNNIKNARNRLRSMDEQGMRWFSARCRHDNPYTYWLASMENNSNLQSANCTLDLRWLEVMRGKYLPKQFHYDEDVRLNELNWMLSRGHGELFSFVPITSHQSNIFDWESHLSNWLTEINRAKFKN